MEKVRMEETGNESECAGSSDALVGAEADCDWLGAGTCWWPPVLLVPDCSSELIESELPSNRYSL